MTNLESLRTNLTESGFELLSPSASLQIRGGGGSKSKKSNKSKKSGKGKKSYKSKGGHYYHCGW
jgi:hypothetical protein